MSGTVQSCWVIARTTIAACEITKSVRADVAYAARPSTMAFRTCAHTRYALVGSEAVTGASSHRNRAIITR